MNDSDDEEAFIEAFERREQERFASRERIRNKRAAATIESLRVQNLIKRDRDDMAREALRRSAEAQVAAGEFANLADTVIEPTPEWINHGDVVSFIPKQPAGTVRVVRSVRRVLTPVVRKMHRNLQISDNQLSACLWYREKFEIAGLTGRWSTSRYSSMVVGGGAGAWPVPMHAAEVQARKEFRDARAALTAFYLRFFEAITLFDEPISKAWRLARSPRAKAEQRFRDAAQELVDYCDFSHIELKLPGAE